MPTAAQFFAGVLVVALATAWPGARADPAGIPGVSGGLAWTPRQITTADRVTITVTVAAEPDIGIDPFAASYTESLTEAGWTTAGTATAAPALTGTGAIAHVSTFIVEPFLDGEYAVPDARVAVILPDGTRAESTIAGGTVTVASVLPADQRDADPLRLIAPDAGEGEPEPENADAPLGTLRPPPPEPSPSPGPLTILGLGISGIIGILIVRTVAVKAGRARRAEPDPVKLLSRLAQRDATPADLDEADRVLHRALRARLIDRSPQIESVLRRFEHARYAPDRSGVDAMTLIADAARVARSHRREATR